MENFHIVNSTAYLILNFWTEWYNCSGASEASSKWVGKTKNYSTGSKKWVSKHFFSLKIKNKVGGHVPTLPNQLRRPWLDRHISSSPTR